MLSIHVWLAKCSCVLSMSNQVRALADSRPFFRAISPPFRLHICRVGSPSGTPGWLRAMVKDSHVFHMAGHVTTRQCTFVSRQFMHVRMGNCEDASVMPPEHCTLFAVGSAIALCLGWIGAT